jgi:MFS family permease
MTLQAWSILLVLCGAIFLEGIDVSMMGVALPAIQSDLGMSTASLQWVVSAYVLGYGGFMLLGGRAADLLGRRRMFLLWLIVFLAFSGLGGLATEGWILILARFVTGVAAAFMTPAGLSIITTSFPEGPARNKALLVYSGTAAAGFTLGLVAGGLLTEFHWRWVFFAPVLLSAAILLFAMRLIPDDGRPARVDGGFDILGATTVTGAMLVLVYGMVMATEVAAWQTIVTLLAAAALLIAFVIAERRSAAPLVRLGIFRSVALVRSNFGAMLFAGSFVGFQFIVVLYLQQVRGWSALETGLALLVAGIDAILAPTLTPRLVERFGTAKVILGGAFSATAGYALFLRIDEHSTYVSDMLPTMILIGIAFSLAYGPFTIAATDGIDSGEQGLASGLLYTSWQFGSALGLALVTAIQISATGDSTSVDSLLDGFRTALIVPVAAAVLSAIVIASGLRARRDPKARARKFVPASD